MALSSSISFGLVARHTQQACTMFKIHDETKDDFSYGITFGEVLTSRKNSIFELFDFLKKENCPFWDTIWGPLVYEFYMLPLRYQVIHILKKKYIETITLYYLLNGLIY